MERLLGSTTEVFFTGGGAPIDEPLLGGGGIEENAGGGGGIAFLFGGAFGGGICCFLFFSSRCFFICRNFCAVSSATAGPLASLAFFIIARISAFEACEFVDRRKLVVHEVADE